MIDPYHSYQGVIVPMASPFNEKGELDRKAAGVLIEFLLKHHTVPFIMGTTGEATSISIHEREEFVRVLVAHKKENIPLIAGLIGLPYTETIEEANKYFKLGVDSVVLTLPNYYPLNHEQMYHYFKSASENINGNIILYNIPKTTHMSIPVEVIDELSKERNIIGIKDSEFDEGRLVLSLMRWKNRNDFFHLTGVNKLMVRGMELGSRGIVPSTANFDPQIYRNLYDSCLEGKYNEAQSLLNRTQELCDIYQKDRSLGESLAALKTILSFMELCKGEVCLPLTRYEGEEARKIIDNYTKTIKYEN